MLNCTTAGWMSCCVMAQQSRRAASGAVEAGFFRNMHLVASGFGGAHIILVQGPPEVQGGLNLCKFFVCENSVQKTKLKQISTGTVCLNFPEISPLKSANLGN